MNLSFEEHSDILVPAIKEFPLTLECKVVYKQMQDKSEIPENYLTSFYLEDVDSSFHGANKDIHIAYYGEMVNAYIVK